MHWHGEIVLIAVALRRDFHHRRWQMVGFIYRNTTKIQFVHYNGTAPPASVAAEQVNGGVGKGAAVVL
jgi:hypothetical protein